MMAIRSRRGLLPAVLALAGVMPFGAEALEPSRSPAAIETPRGVAATETPRGVAATETPRGAAATGTPRGAAATGTPRGAAATGTPRGAAATGTPRGAAATGTRRRAAPATQQTMPGEFQRGVAAVYDARRFTGRPMANGARFHPELPVAAHRYLPLGTRAEVTNLRTGQTTVVTISDRGPFTPGRILDLSPRSAREIGMGIGLAQVEVRPLGQFASR